MNKSELPITQEQEQILRKSLHYPDCWDTMAYPTLFDALNEWAKCSTCAPQVADTYANKVAQNLCSPEFPCNQCIAGMKSQEADKA